jgi:Phage integrase family
MVDRAGKATGFDMKIHPHMPRHACGFKLANDGVDTRTIQAYLGHKSIQHTVRYTELAPTRFKSLFGTELLRNLAQKGAPFFLMIKGDPTPMVPIEGGARKRCVKHPFTSLPPSSARPKNTPLKITQPLLFLTPCYLF